jgi:4-hydroxy-3-polyprenylbenzoate decarboxylase
MSYSSLHDCVIDLIKHGHALRVSKPVDPNLQIAEIQRRLYLNGGPAVLFENVAGTKFPAVANLYGSMDRLHFMFRKTLKPVQKVISLKANPEKLMQRPWSYAGLPWAVFKALPLRSLSAPVLKHQTTMSQLPLVKSWPDDGGPFITLPQVFSEDLDKPGVMNSNLGMYRIQMLGNEYETDKEIGLHYQIHRGIGVHHAKALAKKQPFRVSIFVGGPPAHTFAAVMPLPEGLTELTFAGMLAGRNFRYTRKNSHVIAADADFCIVGTVDPSRTLPEGPFGDHLGYYSLTHHFPVLRVEAVYHRANAIWPFTVVGRPPQEDTTFGKFIHELTSPLVPQEIPGLKALHAVDATGVHPLLLSIGSERYVPYSERKPQEILTIANAILGFGQCSLAKFLMIVAGEDDPSLDIHHIDQYLKHLLERINWETDLHFQTNTTMDTLDYSGTGFNAGSKVVMAAAGVKRRELATKLEGSWNFPDELKNPKVVLPGIVAAELKPFTTYTNAISEIEALCKKLESLPWQKQLPLIVLVDDSEFCRATLNNFLWVCFTRANPSHDTYGVESFIKFKHWGCKGSLIIDARIKPHHAPPLIEDPAVTKSVNEWTKGSGLEKFL